MTKFLHGRERAMQDPRYGDPRWSPAGFVFMVTERDVEEQLRTLIFGYPESGWDVVQKIVKGTPIFLFDMHHQVQCRYHFKYSPTPRWMFQKVPGLFFDNTLRVDRLLSEEQVQKMYDIFNVHRRKSLQHFLVSNSAMTPLGALPLVLQLNGSRKGQAMLTKKGDSDLHQKEVSITLQQSRMEQPQEATALRPVCSTGKYDEFEHWDDAPLGPKPFGQGFHGTYSEVVPKKRFKGLPHHYVTRRTPDQKPKKVLDRADDGHNTTVMIGNIPDGLTADHCVDSLDGAGFFASYDYLRFVPTVRDPIRAGPRFGSLLLNMTSREAAEAVFDEVDTIVASWPPYLHPRFQLPVRWGRHQGLHELESAHGKYAFYLNGLPGNWAIPDEAPIFFELPEDPYEVQNQNQSKAQPSPAAWADAYQYSLEAGLEEEGEIRETDDTLGQIQDMEPALWQPADDHDPSYHLPGDVHLPPEDRHRLIFPDPGLHSEEWQSSSGVRNAPPPEDPGLPPQLLRGTFERDVHLKRSRDNVQEKEGSKRAKRSPERYPQSSPSTTALHQPKPSAKAAATPSATASAPSDHVQSRKTAEQLRKEDIERRLNSALGSSRSRTAPRNGPGPSSRTRAKRQVQAISPRNLPMPKSSSTDRPHGLSRTKLRSPNPDVGQDVDKNNGAGMGVKRQPIPKPPARTKSHRPPSPTHPHGFKASLGNNSSERQSAKPAGQGDVEKEGSVSEFRKPHITKPPARTRSHRSDVPAKQYKAVREIRSGSDAHGSSHVPHTRHQQKLPGPPPRPPGWRPTDNISSGSQRPLQHGENCHMSAEFSSLPKLQRQAEPGSTLETDRLADHTDGQRASQTSLRDSQVQAQSSTATAMMVAALDPDVELQQAEENSNLVDSNDSSQATLQALQIDTSPYSHLQESKEEIDPTKSTQLVEMTRCGEGIRSGNEVASDAVAKKGTVTEPDFDFGANFIPLF